MTTWKHITLRRINSNLKDVSVTSYHGIRILYGETLVSTSFSYLGAFELHQRVSYMYQYHCGYDIAGKVEINPKEQGRLKQRMRVLEKVESLYLKSLDYRYIMWYPYEVLIYKLIEILLSVKKASLIPFVLDISSGVMHASRRFLLWGKKLPYDLKLMILSGLGVAHDALFYYGLSPGSVFYDDWVIGLLMNRCKQSQIRLTRMELAYVNYALHEVDLRHNKYNQHACEYGFINTPFDRKRVLVDGFRGDNLIEGALKYSRKIIADGSEVIWKYTRSKTRPCNCRLMYVKATKIKLINDLDSVRYYSHQNIVLVKCLPYIYEFDSDSDDDVEDYFLGEF